MHTDPVCPAHGTAYQFDPEHRRCPRPANPTAWRAGNTPSPSCSRMPVTPPRSTANGTLVPRLESCPTIRVMTNGGASTKVRHAAGYTSTPQFDPAVAEIPSYLAGCKRKGVHPKVRALSTRRPRNRWTGKPPRGP